MKTLYFLFFLTISVNLHAKLNEVDTEKAIKKGRLYYCLESSDSQDSKKTRIIFDGVSKFSHYPFSTNNTVKLLKSEKIDSEFPVFKYDYVELKGKKKVAIFSITLQHNDVWEASYKAINSKKAISLNSETYDLSKLNSVCFGDLGN